MPIRPEPITFPMPFNKMKSQDQVPGNIPEMPNKLLCGLGKLGDNCAKALGSNGLLQFFTCK